MVAVSLVLVMALPSAGSATGRAELWVARYDGGSYDAATSVAVSPNGSRVFVTGSSTGDYATVAYDAATGAKVWGRRYDGPGNGNDAASSIALSPDGSTVFVTGFSAGSTGFWDYATIAYDAAFGAKLWVARYGESGNHYDEAKSLVVSPDGSRVFVTGVSQEPYQEDDVTVAYDASTGAMIWTKRLSRAGSGANVSSSMALSSDGSRVFVTGYSVGSNGYWDYATVAYDASTGVKDWFKRYHGPGTGNDSASSVAVSPDGSRVFVTGFSTGSTPYWDYATVAYDAATGAEVWVKRYHGLGNGYDAANSIAVSPDGSRVFVTGNSTGSNGYWDYATVAYDASTGRKVWVRRYNGPGHADDAASSVAVSPDGSRVFVTGSSSGSNGYGDYATIAYSAS
jgi:WD40 repeat protein